MCGICGCSDPKNDVVVIDPDSGEKTIMRQGGLLGHDHESHHHSHDSNNISHIHDPKVIDLETAVLAKNDAIAERNRHWFQDRGVLALNLVSSPGAGKTTVLERTIRELGHQIEIAVIEGDQMTMNDAHRIRAAGAKAIQINTGAGCHLEADMIAQAIACLDLAPGAILLIENVGNLVCPAMFDLGEYMKIAVISTTEGEDKPLKYPHMFRVCDLVLINKIDLAPHVDFDEKQCRRNIAEVNPKANVISLSGKSGDGFKAWTDWLEGQHGPH